jgi:hypothetical protein
VRPSRSLALLPRYDETIALKYRKVLADSHARKGEGGGNSIYSGVTTTLEISENLFFSGLQDATFYWLNR